MMSLLAQAAHRTPSLVRCYSCHVVNCHKPVVLPRETPLHQRSDHVDGSSSIHVISPYLGDQGRQSVTQINTRVREICDDSVTYGLGVLDPHSMELTISDIQENEGKLRGYVLDCRMIAEGESDYKRCFYLFQLCAEAGLPVGLYRNSGCSVTDTAVVARALCRIISDGILDYYPNLRLVLFHEGVIPLLGGALLGNHPGNSLQKHELEYYLYGRNVYCVYGCDSPGYLKYLEGVLSRDNILFGGETVIVPPSLPDLTLQKIMNRNASHLLNLPRDNRIVTYRYHPDHVTVLDSPAVRLLSSKVRDKSTSCRDFMIYSDRLMRILAEEALSRASHVVPRDIVTPTGIYRGLADTEDCSNLCVVSIVRSGDILLEAVRSLVPGIKVGKVLIQRDESSPEKTPIYYYNKLPPSIGSCSTVFLVDPMLATGGSALCALNLLVERGVAPRNIIFVNLFSCEEGLRKLLTRYKDLQVVTLAVDEYLNEEKYIVPGVGDFGDRYYGTTED